jgi:hypothetical protein
MYEENERCMQGLVGKPEGKNHLGGLRPRHRWEDNIKIDCQEIRWGTAADWIGLAQGRDRWRALVKTVMNFRVA